MRVTILCLALGLSLLTACQDKHDQAPAAVAPAAADASTAGTPGARNMPPTSDLGRPGDLGMHPEIAPKIVTDTTPVDTQVMDVKLSDNGDGKTLTGLMTNQFKATDGVFMSIRTQGTAGKYTLSSKWLAPNGQTLTEYSQNISTPGPIDTIFSLSKPDGWSKGQYHVELSVNGKQLRTVPFSVH